MKRDQFLSPSFSKFALFVIIFASYTVGINYVYNATGFEEPPLIVFLVVAFLILPVFALQPLNFISLSPLSGILIMLFIALVYQYFLSAVIIALFSKLTGQRKISGSQKITHVKFVITAFLFLLLINLIVSEMSIALAPDLSLAAPPRTIEFTSPRFLPHIDLIKAVLIFSGAFILGGYAFRKIRLEMKILLNIVASFMFLGVWVLNDLVERAIYARYVMDILPIFFIYNVIPLLVGTAVGWFFMAKYARHR